ncbi:hypothetical protein ACOSP7_029283 [Xanthoceras sorbifolium]
MMLSGVVVARGHPGRPLGTHLVDLNFNHDDSGKYFNMFENFWYLYPYPEDTCTPEPTFVYISNDENVEYLEDDTVDSETDDVADSEYSSESNYNPDSYEVIQEDDTAGSNSETIHAATVDDEDCNKDKTDEPAKTKRSTAEKCRKCGEVGYNIRTCSNPVVGAHKPNQKNPKGGTKRMSFEVGSSSTLAIRRKLNLGDSANAPRIQNV